MWLVGAAAPRRQKIMAANTIGPANLAFLVGRQMMATKTEGRIINIRCLTE